MTIGAIGQMNSSYIMHQVPNIPQVDVETVRKQEQSIAEAGRVDAAKSQLQEAPAREPAEKNANLEDISLNFNTGETYDYIGRDSALENLDVQKAVSDMQKDQVLQQYQYFVGTQDLGGMVLNNQDGVVLQK